MYVISDILMHIDSTGEKVGYTQWRTMEQDYGAPYYHIHRADFHRLLFDLVQDTHNVTLKLASTVTALNPIPDQNDKVTLTLQVRNYIIYSPLFRANNAFVSYSTLFRHVHLSFFSSPFTIPLGVPTLER
jgi:hypothetical protein